MNEKKENMPPVDGEAPLDNEETMVAYLKTMDMDGIRSGFGCSSGRILLI